MPRHATTTAPDPACVAAVRQLWDYLDAELTEARMEQVRHHLAVCQRCLPHYEFGRTLLAALAERRATDELPEPVRTRVMHALAGAGFGAER